MDCDLVLKNIRLEFANYFRKYNLQSAVIGISGGIDSALVAAISRPVCDALKIPLIGLSMPSSSNKSDEVDRAEQVGISFCTKFDTIHIDNLVEAFKINLAIEEPENKEEKIALGNIKARVRMITLYDTAFRNKGLVLSTDNLTEYYLGFWTLAGDIGDFSPIQFLWKTEVYKLSRHICKRLSGGEKKYGLLRAIDAVATDGLGISSSDIEQLGVSSYDEVDKILISYLNKDFNELSLEIHESPVIKRMVATEFKRNHPYVISREKLFAE